MTEMTENQTAKIRKGLSARRDPACLQVLRDIAIPAGTILRAESASRFVAPLGDWGEISVTVKPGEPVPSFCKRVIA